MPTRENRQTKDTLADLRPHIAETRELPTGYSLLFTDHPSPVRALVEFLSLEELSCPSIKIEMAETAEAGVDGGDRVWVHFTGDACVKEFVRDELVGE